MSKTYYEVRLPEVGNEIASAIALHGPKATQAVAGKVIGKSGRAGELRVANKNGGVVNISATRPATVLMRDGRPL